MFSVIKEIEKQYEKPQVTQVRSGDTVRVSQKIKEGNKERTQVFEGLVIRTRRQGSLTSAFTVRRIASGVGVEKTFLAHSPTVEKVEVTKRANVRRNYLSYMRERGGKSARLASVDFDKNKVNVVEVPEDTSKEAKEAAKQLAADEAEQNRAEAKAEDAKDEAAAAKAEKTDSSAETQEEPKEAKADDKAQDKKAKAEAFRKAQESKNS